MIRTDLLLQLITEISSFILEGRPNRMVISLHQEPGGLHLAILDDKKRTDEEITEISRALNKTKRPELSGYYGTMTGHDFLGNARLDMLGWQVKHADVNRTAEGIKIDLWLGNDKFDPTNFNLPS
ncbi:MAG: hypothetical protein JW760_08330 [Spirochaetales bacterium]|nr:hypothetical protein [Spirochaetales bacterium]